MRVSPERQARGGTRNRSRAPGALCGALPVRSPAPAPATAPHLADRRTTRRRTLGDLGSVSHNVKAVYQHYLGWFDGNPAQRYVDFMGGPEHVLRRARESFAAGDFRWVAQVVNHVVFTDPGNAEARALQADALEQLGHGSENGTWRNFYLTGALELRTGSVGTPTVTNSPDLLAALTLDQLVDSLAIRVDGPRSRHADLTIRFSPHGADPVNLRLRNGVLVHTTGTTPEMAEPDTDITLSDAELRTPTLTSPSSLPDSNPCSL
ncbi:alkyl sulfatase dimerization domain-containing protein [Streptomyces koelreuteriae]|uniref:alkyl sulfatase dimerization domain-containing protein n=1 Tax=Streptomyces koelreuteriae TaxID=2838015 RepID=UPI003EBDA27A